MTTPTDRQEQLTRLARGWDAAADGYDAYFVPRFAPWLADAVDAIVAPAPPDGPALPAPPEGPVLVPCCGSFPELDALTAGFGDREIVGIDLSAGMVRRARDRAAGHRLVRVEQGDASTLDPRWTGRCAAVLSVFGLQQLPEPEVALRSWARALRPGGRLSVAYWPEVTETAGPFALISEVVRGQAPPPDHSWEERLVPALTGSGLTVERDDHPAHPMRHADAAAFVDAFVHSGPARALAIARGTGYVERLREEFLRRAPSGELHHRPRARLLVARR